MFPFADYMSTGRDYDGLSLSGYRRSSCYAAAAATTNHHDNAGGRSSVGKPRDLITTERNPCFFGFISLNQFLFLFWRLTMMTI